MWNVTSYERPINNPVDDSADLINPLHGQEDYYPGITSLSEYHLYALEPGKIERLRQTNELDDQKYARFMEAYNNDSFTDEQKLRVLFSLLSGTQIDEYLNISDETEDRLHC